MKHVVFVLFIATVTLSKALPAAESGGDSGAVVSSINLGSVTTCIRPPTNECSMINYAVPASIAALTPIIEHEIQGALMNPLVERCNKDGVREVLCAFRFPRCEDGAANVVYMKSAPNCMEKIAGCHPSIRSVFEAEGLCQLDATVPLDSCAPLSESQVQFQRCSVIEASTSVTAWMLEYMKLSDAEWGRKLNDSSGLSTLWTRPECSNNLLRYYCGFYGQCTGDGQIKVTNTEGFCNDMISCYPDTTASSLMDSVDCALWPSRSEVPPTTQPPKTLPPGNSKPTASSRPQLPSWPGPPTSGNHVSLQVTGILLLISLVLSIFILR